MTKARTPRNGKKRPPVDMNEDGASREDQGPVRTCTVSRREYPRDHLLRFVVDPEGRVVEDLSGRLPGRGLHVHPDPESLRKLLKQPGIFAKLAGRPVEMPIPEAFFQRLGPGLTRRLLDGVGLARRAGVTRFGLDELLELLVAGQRPALLLLAGDTARNTRDKLARMLARQTVPWPVWEVLTRAELGAACGHKPVAVISILDPGLARKIDNDARRWREFHAMPPMIVDAPSATTTGRCDTPEEGPAEEAGMERNQDEGLEFE